MLSAYRVLDLADERAQLGAFILAQMGAEVIAIEPPGGSSSRKVAPFAHDVEDLESSLQHWAYNRGRRALFSISTTQLTKKRFFVSSRPPTS